MRQAPPPRHRWPSEQKSWTWWRQRRTGLPACPLACLSLAYCRLACPVDILASSNVHQKGGIPVNTQHPTRRAALGASALGALAYRRLLGANDRVQVGFIGYGLI